MTAQVSAVVNGTIVSAEDWYERLSRIRGGEGSGSSAEAGLLIGEGAMLTPSDSGALPPDQLMIRHFR